MTNNPTIDGVSRDAFKWAIQQLEEDGHKGCGYFDSLRAILDTPAVERQEAYGFASVLIDNFRFAIDNGKQPTFSKGDLLWLIEQLSKAQSESDALQSTIAQLEDKLNKAIDLDFQRRETIARLEGRIAELESGRGEPVAWRYQSHFGGLWYLSSSEHNARTFQCNGQGGQVEPLFTAPPASVAVIRNAQRYEYLRERDLETIKHGGVFAGLTPDNLVLNGEDLDSAIDACLDAAAALNEGRK